MPSTGYETLLYECLQGDATLFQRADGVEDGWRILTPVLDVWQALKPREFQNYAAGRWGPAATDDLLVKDGRQWRRPRVSTVAFDASAKAQGGHVADTQAVTLVRYLLNEQAEHPETEPEFWALIAQMAYVAKVIALETRRAALVGRLGQRSRSIARRSLV